MDGDIPYDRPGNNIDEDMYIWLSHEDSEYSDIEFALADDDEYPVESLQPTIGSLYKATTNEQDDFTLSTITNHWSHTSSCSSGMATGITNQLSLNSALGTFQLNLDPILENQQHWRSRNMQYPTFIPPTQCHGIMLSHVSSQTQDHSKTCLMYQMPPKPQFRTDHSAFTQPERVASCEALACTDTAMAASQQHQSHHQQLCSELTVHPFTLPLPNTSMLMQNPQPYIISQELNPPLRKNLAQQHTESSPVQIISLGMMQQFVRTFKNRSVVLGLTPKEIDLVFYKLSGKEISQIWIAQFRRFCVFFDNICQMKSLLEISLDRIYNSKTTTHTFRNSQIDDHLANNRPDSTTHEDTNNRISQGGGNVSDNNINHAENDVDKYEETAELLNSTVSSHCNATSNKKVVSSCSSRKNHVENIVICLNHKGECVQNLHSYKLCLVHQPVKQNSEQISFDALQHFVNYFWKSREELRFSQYDILLELREICGRNFKWLCIRQFEEFNVFFKEMCELKPQLEQWLENVHISRADLTNIMGYRSLLERSFEVNQNPVPNIIDALAKTTNLDKDLLTFWFDKRRQIHEWHNNLTA